jgi:hypothetical protein
MGVPNVAQNYRRLRRLPPQHLHGYLGTLAAARVELQRPSHFRPVWDGCPGEGRGPCDSEAQEKSSAHAMTLLHLRGRLIANAGYAKSSVTIRPFTNSLG